MAKTRVYPLPLYKMCQETEVEVWDGVDKEGVQALRRNFHSQYLFDCQNELGIEYFDSPKILKGEENG